MKNFSLAYLWNTPRNGVFFIIAFTIIFWTLQCSLLQSVLGLDILEAVSWGAHGDLWGNAKHPPLSGWIAYGFSKLSGGKDWSLYLAAQICLSIGIYFTYRTAKLFLDEYSAAAGAVLLASCYYYCPSLLKFSTFFVEISLMPVIAYAYFSAMRKKNISSWILLGAICAVAFINKYSIGLLFISMAVLTLSTKEYRDELKSCRPYIAAVVFIAVIFPHINWLIKNDFVCLGHVGNRLNENYKWYEPLVVAATAVYPTAVMLAVLAIAAVPVKKQLENKCFSRDTFKWSCMFTAIPAAILFVNSLLGSSVITMWFSTLASFCGILAVTVFPYKIDKKIYRNIIIIVTIYMVCFFIGTTIDLAVNSRPRLHMDTKAVAELADLEWKKIYPQKTIPFVVGDRWFGNVVSHYHKDKPAILEMDKELKDNWKRCNYIDKALSQGAVIIGRKKELFKDFAEELHRRSGQKIDFTYNASCPYKAVFGKAKTRQVFISVIRAKQ